MSRVVTVTVNPTVDVHFEIEQIVPERKLRSTIPVRHPGGGGINVSRVLSRLGKVSHALFTRGGELGQMISRMLKEENIRYLPMDIAGLTREDYMVKERATGNMLRFNLPGPDMSDDEIEQTFTTIVNYVEQGDYLVLSGSLPPKMPEDFYFEIVQSVSQKGVRCIVDTSGAPLKKVVESNVFLLKPNLKELTEIYGRNIYREEEQLLAAKSLVDKGMIENVVLSLGADGALLVNKDTHIRSQSPKVEVVSRVGAGDSMTAGIVYGLSEGYNIENAIKYGIAAGAATVMTPGTELCRGEDIEHILGQLN
ncbi:1-phosphofructokinase family hexose kinase [Chitinispirillales bacterium ANBcel5]|uniref:1-phosphofructokinase family hexose kinase n=1 Tax=Cellulosispirillum alkaliphilum TaxID=3039283 RepID=UPI002A58EB12|nr:1-phosphofructokinase family hexose kinase [Chitinispirillales bacterium ANBcel5]